MFDIGFWEFALIGVITLIVVGPERMPAIAKTAGHYIGKAKRFVAKVQEDIGDEIEADKLKEHLNLEDKDANIIEIFDQTKESLNEIKRDVDQ
ncbi:Sec-independent protein translocase protein TatB [bacterium endosymbiont of Bathymodiolus sp. 5 South]|jgi:sec-independent protein translocase protein TatB|uniref:Sec-independent protein translocase protein TatB n=1 Tax=bacterium endosymbiont of Bathymodiolus sp. 5 South TaxID=1181670 RepID=UPI000255FEAB|nr:Sec-independent protein translocase protein TatB [bacterium endosymbiont of Bathymodiolus sp. 5 South]CAC9434675.1 Twin-arginine translocation protein TatB [uncultured Gammaproteobacteria bacterium]CAC9640773.1 Twin-arginine translocation protein TatB [uncultured Gammaproteobacteria bacterium]SHN90180.1 Twin-arginine translocation protein TatB [bacterium endosymbiont of Bathymodiolus sp. 5 South]SSC08869.1 Twin-arginine translocation protein TatB [bacterium endosymbiont of Bathymodiolus sp. 